MKKHHCKMIITTVVIFFIITLLFMSGRWIAAIIVIGSLLILTLLAVRMFFWVKNHAKRNIHFTTLGNESGKIIMKGKDVVGIISNIKGAYYDDKGELHESPNPKNYGSLFKELGIVFFGITPIKEIYELSAEWNEYVEKESREIKRGKNEEGEKDPKKPYEIAKRTEKLDYFKRFYAHAIEILRVEMADGSKVDLVFIVTFEILNIIQVLFKIKPDGIVLAQAETAFATAIEEELKLLDYKKFRNDTDKSDQTKPFVLAVLGRTNAIIADKFHLRAVLMETKFYDLSKGEPGDEAFEEAQTKVKLADIEGDAKIALAKKMKIARTVEGKGEAAYFREIGKEIGKANIPNYANLEQVKETQLLSYGQGSTPVMPVVPIPLKKKRSTPVMPVAPIPPKKKGSTT